MLSWNDLVDSHLDATTYNETVDVEAVRDVLTNDFSDDAKEKMQRLFDCYQELHAVFVLLGKGVLEVEDGCVGVSSDPTHEFEDLYLAALIIQSRIDAEESRDPTDAHHVSQRADERGEQVGGGCCHDAPPGAIVDVFEPGFRMFRS